MKTLDQVEPRTAVNATNTPGDADSLFRISQPGSYYLTANITGVSGKNGIEIASGNVTVDLNGFELVGGAGTLNGILFPDAGGSPGNTIRNGTLRVWGGDGVRAVGASASRFENLGVAFNTGIGIRTGFDNTITGCRAHNNGSGGILVGGSCVLTACTASFNTGAGFSTFGTGNSFIQCAARSNTANGFNADTRSTFESCSAVSNQGSGISALNGSSLHKCVASANADKGITVDSSSVVAGCTAYQNGTGGIIAADGSTITHCTAAENTSGPGIQAGHAATLTNCTAGGNAGPYGIHVQEAGTLVNCTVRGHNNPAATAISAGHGATLQSCTAEQNVCSFGIIAGSGSALANCASSFNTSNQPLSFGMIAGSGSTVSHCTASFNTSTAGTLTPNTGGGFLLGAGSTIQGCTAASNKGDGIRIDIRCVVTGCTVAGDITADGAAIHAADVGVSGDNRIEGNQVSNSARGIQVESPGNIILKNTATDNTTAYVIAANNRYGPIVNITAVGTAAVNGSSAASTAATTDPWANFAY